MVMNNHCTYIKCTSLNFIHLFYSVRISLPLISKRTNLIIILLKQADLSDKNIEKPKCITFLQQKKYTKNVINYTNLSFYY